VNAAGEAEDRRLRWRCRRGLLELDLLLERFLVQDYDRLSQWEKDCFARLLETDDNTLLGYFNGVSTPDEKEFIELVKRIRA
jgi:antitoxin CptB